MRICKKDLLLKPLKRCYAVKLKENVRLRRQERSQNLINRFRNREEIFNIWFTDEKMFYLAPPKNSQNDRLFVNRNTIKATVPQERLIKEIQRKSPHM